MPHPDGGNVVVFGTGKIFEDTDAATVDKETIYGVWDKNPSVKVVKTQLVQQIGRQFSMVILFLCLHLLVVLHQLIIFQQAL
jgi:Tfp pilus tip-associated adhesin PilY1